MIGEDLEQKVHLRGCVQEVREEKVLIREQDPSAFHSRETTLDRSRTAEGRYSLEAETQASALGRNDENRPRRSWKGEEAEWFHKGPMVIVGMSGHARPLPKLLAWTCRETCHYGY